MTAQALSLGAEDRRLLNRSRAIIGIDEVGRGSLAGPVVVCGAKFGRIPESTAIRDSKRMSAAARERESRWIRRHADDWLVLEVWPDVIDRINILEATRLAMRTIVSTLYVEGDAVVVDAVDLGPSFDFVTSVPKADDTYFSVAAASVVAKVHRDRVMANLARSHSFWGWEDNKGYGTKAHREAISRLGRSCFHRRSFKVAPVLP